ncbi:unnamed protein product, partial [Closterium sp. NIES-54]
RADLIKRAFCQRSTGDPRLILRKGYRLVVPGGYGCTDPLLNKPFYPSGLVAEILTWYQSEGLGFESQCVHFGHPSAGWSSGWDSDTFLTSGISNALDGSEDGLAMAHRRSQLTAEVDVDDSIIADGFFGNNCQEPESDEE